MTVTKRAFEYQSDNKLKMREWDGIVESPDSSTTKAVVFVKLVCGINKRQ
ncbi:MAG: hypothetical protein ACI8RD_012431 [Bacillariaceae sp.]|jgi:hypothetical protein